MSEAAPPIDVAIAGATGVVGQRFIEGLQSHPYFRLVAVAASDRSAGQTYGEAVNWQLDSGLPPDVAGMTVLPVADLVGHEARVVFSALPSKVAGPAETDLADAGKAVLSNASSHRMDRYVPLLIPEVNPEHLSLALQQPGDGFIVANANCSSIGLTLAVAPLEQEFGIAEMHVFTGQALSGAGYPGVSALDIVDNVIPYIEGEEEKLRTEPAKMLGSAFRPADIEVRVTTTRVNVTDGHLIAAHIMLQEGADLDQIHRALEDFRGLSDVQNLPSAPERPVHVHYEANRPQPRLDRDAEGGMAVSVGRIRQAGKLGRRAVDLVALIHNTKRGAAGQSILNAELAFRRGLFYRP
jgi:aspartate-semialdehyde dehydrogenase